MRDGTDSDGGTGTGRPRVAMVLPCLDEEEALPEVLAGIPRHLVDEVIVVDNGSRDGSARVAKALGARVVEEPRRGYGAACLAGIEAAGEAGVVVFMDADRSDDPEDLARLLEPILSGEADFVLGSRMVLPEARAALPPQARHGNRLATFLMRLLLGARYSDLGPFRAIRRDALDRLSMRDRGFGWTVEMQIRAHRAGLRTLEIPVRYRKRLGRSKISGTLTGTLRAGTRILWTIFRHALAPPPAAPSRHG